ncbi:MAG: pirin family protein [Oleispira sp.]|nr:pirin family protein [Oleispira sp.]MBL4879914.1 pirin family protein [Oleispira sp.]
MNILSRDSLPRGGFAGIEETRLVKDAQIGGKTDTWDGLGNFVYLADARYVPFGESGMHPHLEVDVITIMLEGRLTHEGSMEHGQSMVANQAQVQRAGGEGFDHNEINPDESRTRLLQVWALPETAGSNAAYKIYDTNDGQLHRIYGGNPEQSKSFDSHTVIDTGLVYKDFEVKRTGETLVYVVNGEAIVNGKLVKDGDLIRADVIDLKVISEDAHLTLISLESN